MTVLEIYVLERKKYSFNKLDCFILRICRSLRSTCVLGNSIVRESAVPEAHVRIHGERDSKVHQFKEIQRQRSREISFLPHSRVYTETELHINARFSTTLIKLVTTVCRALPRVDLLRLFSSWHLISILSR